MTTWIGAIEDSAGGGEVRIRVLGLGSLCPDGRAACCNSLRDTGMEIGMPFVWSMGVEKCFVRCRRAFEYGAREVYHRKRA